VLVEGKDRSMLTPELAVGSIAQGLAAV